RGSRASGNEAWANRNGKARLIHPLDVIALVTGRKCMREFTRSPRSALKAVRFCWESKPMSSKRRACVVVVSQLGLVALLALLQSADAAPQVRPAEKGGAIQAAPPAPKGPPTQPAPPNRSEAENEFTDAITLPTDRTVKKRLEAARDNYIRYEAWSDAA